MKRILGILTIFFIFTAISAQRTRDVVYLKNGSVIKGVVTEMEKGGTLKVRTSDGSLFVYPTDDVVRIEKEGKKRFAFHRTEKGFRPYYTGSVELGYNGGAQLSTSHGYQILPYLYTGVGAGITYWGDSDFSTPVFVNVRGVLPSKSDFSPYADTRLGYTFEDSVYFTLSVGCLYRIDERYAVRLGVGLVAEGEEYASLSFALDF